MDAERFKTFTSDLDPMGNLTSDNRLQLIARALFSDAFPKIGFHNTTVFLVGASYGRAKNLRGLVREELTEKQPFFGIDVYYPEDLFEELLGRKGYDLLELENMLADSVDAVVILLESPGAIAELGAFANHSKLCKKLVVIIDRRHKGTRSFIMLGPIKYLRNNKYGKVIFHDLTAPVLSKLGTDIRKAVSNLKKGSKHSPSRSNILLSNPIHARVYLLLCLHILEAAPYESLEVMISAVTDDKARSDTIVTRTAIRILLNEGNVELEGRKYRLTAPGKSLVKHMSRFSTSREALDKARIDFLNWSQRKPRRLRLEEGV